MKYDEQELLDAVFLKQSGESVHDVISRANMDASRSRYLLLKWRTREWYEFDDDIGLGKLTDKGKALAQDCADKRDRSKRELRVFLAQFNEAALGWQGVETVTVRIDYIKGSNVGELAGFVRVVFANGRKFSHVFTASQVRMASTPALLISELQQRIYGQMSATSAVGRDKVQEHGN